MGGPKQSQTCIYMNLPNNLKVEDIFRKRGEETRGHKICRVNGLHLQGSGSIRVLY